MVKKVTFSVDTGYVGSKKEETFTLEELGIDENDFIALSELDSLLERAYADWLWDNINAYWWVEDEE